MSDTRHINIEDHAALLAYLRERRWIAADEKPSFRTLTGGVSNRTVWVQRRGQDWVIKQALAKLRVQVDWFSAPERIQREAAGLRWLGELIPEHVPAVVQQDNENNILAMTAVPQPHCNWKTALLAGQTSLAFARSFGELLATIHNAAERYPQLEAEFAERRFFEQLRLEPYYGYAASQLPAARAFMERLIADTRADDSRLCMATTAPRMRSSSATSFSFWIMK